MGCRNQPGAGAELFTNSDGSSSQESIAQMGDVAEVISTEAAQENWEHSNYQGSRCGGKHV